MGDSKNGIVVDEETDLEEIELTNGEPSTPDPLAILTLELALRQRDEATTRCDELEEIVRECSGAASEVERLRTLLRTTAEVLGVQEFESLVEVAQARMQLLGIIQRAEIKEGLRDAARQSSLGRMSEENERLREEIQRLKAKH